MNSITVGTWNIWISRDYNAISQSIQDNKIDIIGIQEARIYNDKKEQENIVEKVAKELGYNFVFYPSVDVRMQRNYIMGNAILSRFPITASKSYSLNPPNITYDRTPETEERILVHSEIALPNKKLNFLTTHLQFSMQFKTTEIRIAQVKNIISVLKKLNQPIILTGDFNCIPQSTEVKMIEKVMNRINGVTPTWPLSPWDYRGWKVETPTYRLDNIFTSYKGRVKKFNIINSKISDHALLSAQIMI